jgi:hypothetical protein
VLTLPLSLSIALPSGALALTLARLDRFGDLQTETAKESKPAAAAAATTDPKLLAREKRFKAQEEAAAAAKAAA